MYSQLQKYSGRHILYNTRRELPMYDKLKLSIGSTPLYKIKKISLPNNNVVLAKEEYKNPTGSHYDRVYLWLFRDLENKGVIKPGITPLIDNSSGNAASSFAWLGSQLGYDCTVVVPEDLPQARINDIKKYNPNIVFSEAGRYVLGTNEKLRNILKDSFKKGNPNGRLYCMNHSENTISLRAMEECAEEISIFNDVHKVDYFIGAIGNGTSLTGMGHILKSKMSCTLVGWDPEEAPVGFSLKHLNQHFEFHSHEVYGTGAWGLKFPHLNVDMLDDVCVVKKEEWTEALKLLHNIEEKPVGNSSAGSLAVAMKMAKKVSNKIFLIIFYDPIWKYK